MQYVYISMYIYIYNYIICIIIHPRCLPPLVKYERSPTIRRYEANRIDNDLVYGIVLCHAINPKLFSILPTIQEGRNDHNMR